MRQNKKLYAVKSTYQWVAAGRSKTKDKFYSRNSRLVEERIVLVQARSFDEALKLAKKESAIYCGPKFTNVYGELVEIKSTGRFDAFELIDSPEPGTELFSSNILVRDKNEANERLRHLIAKGETKHASKLRRKFQQK